MSTRKRKRVKNTARRGRLRRGKAIKQRTDRRVKHARNRRAKFVRLFDKIYSMAYDDHGYPLYLVVDRTDEFVEAIQASKPS